MAGKADMISNRRRVQRAMQAVGLVALLSLAVGAVLTATGVFAGGLAASSLSSVKTAYAAYAPILDDTATPTGTPTPNPCDPVWSSVSSPNPGLWSALRDVAVVTANDMWLVGNNYNCSGGGCPHTLAEHWDGTSWSLVPTPELGTGDNILYGVAAVSANDVWAVGQNCNQTLVEHWNGTSWSVVPSPNPGTGQNFLYGVAAVSATDVWAVGYYSGRTGGTLTEHWDGTSWSVVSTPNVGTQLKDVAAVSANDVWAVGYSGYPSNLTLIEHWDGTS